MRLLRPIWIVGFVFLFVGLIPSIVRFVTDYFWYQEVGYQSVFTTELSTKSLLFAVAAVAAYLFVTLNAKYATSGLSKAPVLWRVSPELPPVDISKSLARVVKPVGILFALLFGLTASGGSQGRGSAAAIDDSALRQVVGSHLHGDLVSGQDTDVVLTHLSGDVRGHDVTGLELHAESSVRQGLDDFAFHLDRIFFRHP